MLRDELLTPFRGIGEAGRDLLTGSAVLAGYACRCLRLVLRAAWRAASKGESFSDRAESFGVAVLAGGAGLAVTAGAAGVLAWVARAYVPFLAGGAAVAWVVAAWVAAPRREPTTCNDHEQWAGEQRPETDPHHGARAIARAVITAVADADRDGYKGVHLAELLDQLRADELTQADEVSQLRAWLETVGIPTNRNLKRDGKGPTWGVRVDELAAALGRPLRDALRALDQTPAEAAPEPPGPAGQEAPVGPLPGAEDQPPPERSLIPVPSPSPGAVA
jgi:hypothetical protein